MESRKGFTIVELMVVILVISILSAASIAILQGKMSASKWTEGKSMMGTIATAIRAYTSVSIPPSAPENIFIGEPNNLGFAKGDLTGAYFSDDDFSYIVTSIEPLVFTVTATNPELFPIQYQLNEKGEWTTPP